MGGDEWVGNNDRLVAGFTLGTVVGTIFTTPINFSAYIYGWRYANPLSSGTVGTVVAEMLTYRLGTLTGTVDVTQVVGNLNSAPRDVPGEIPWGRVEAGDSLVGVIISPNGATASIIGAVAYRLYPGRLSGP